VTGDTISAAEHSVEIVKFAPAPVDKTLIASVEIDHADATIDIAVVDVTHRGSRRKQSTFRPRAGFFALYQTYIAIRVLPGQNERELTIRS
jgi:hypothetical protein